jgi:hypothetical protein
VKESTETSNIVPGSKVEKRLSRVGLGLGLGLECSLVVDHLLYAQGPGFHPQHRRRRRR